MIPVKDMEEATQLIAVKLILNIFLNYTIIWSEIGAFKFKMRQPVQADMNDFSFICVFICKKNLFYVVGIERNNIKVVWCVNI